MSLKLKFLKGYVQQSDIVEKEVNEFCAKYEVKNVKVFIQSEKIIASIVYSEKAEVKA